MKRSQHRHAARRHAKMARRDTAALGVLRDKLPNNHPGKMKLHFMAEVLARDWMARKRSGK